MDMFVRFKGLCLFQANAQSKGMDVKLVNVKSGSSHANGEPRSAHRPKLVVVNSYDVSQSRSIALRGEVRFKFTYEKGVNPKKFSANDTNLLGAVTVDPNAVYNPAKKGAAHLQLSEGRLDPHLLVRPRSRGRRIRFEHSRGSNGRPVTYPELAYEMLWEVSGLKKVEIFVGGNRKEVFSQRDVESGCLDLVIGNLCGTDVSRWGEFVYWDSCETRTTDWADRDFRAYYDHCDGVRSQKDLAYPIIDTQKPLVIAGPSFRTGHRHQCANVLVRGKAVADPKPIVSMGAPTCLNGCGGQC
jgi:hypothetical protein